MILINNIVALKCWSEQKSNLSVKVIAFLCKPLNCFQVITTKTAFLLTVQLQAKTTKYYFSVFQRKSQGKIQLKWRNIQNTAMNGVVCLSSTIEFTNIWTWHTWKPKIRLAMPNFDKCNINFLKYQERNILWMRYYI